MYSESDADAERSVASAPPAADGAVAARGPRAAHPASSVTASATDVVFERMCTVLVFLVQTAVATGDVEHEEYSEHREQNDGGSVHVISPLND
jgi:hypothetical protein